MREITGWSKEEIEELKKGIYSHYDSMAMIYSIVHGNSNPKLWAKYMDCEPQQLTQMARDIIDFYDDTARFPEQKYYIQLIKNNDLSYIHKNKLNHFLILGDYGTSQNYQTEFTEQEIKDIDPRYMAFAVPVEDNDEI